MKSVSVSRPSGFTIVELLIVIVVIAILATISVIAYTGIQERARVTAANSELRMLERAILMGRETSGKVLTQITGSGCTGCAGTQTTYETTLDRIAAASGANLSALKKGDPWGGRYYIDENELEAGSCANRDWVGVHPGRPGVSGITIPFYQCS